MGFSKGLKFSVFFFALLCNVECEVLKLQKCCRDSEVFEASSKTCVAGSNPAQELELRLGTDKMINEKDIIISGIFLLSSKSIKFLMFESLTGTMCDPVYIKNSNK